MENIWYIHGANETATCFNYVKAKLPNHSMYDIEYDCHAPLQDTITKVNKQLPKDNISIIGHSLGGVIAVALSQRNKNKINKVVTLASPFGGSESAYYLKYIFPAYGLFKNVSSTNPYLQSISKTGAVVPTLNIIATTGYNPLSAARNDGVITIDCQRKLPKAIEIEVLHNHFEVLLADEVISLVYDFIWDNLKSK